jgi:hypothetical protein
MFHYVVAIGYGPCHVVSSDHECGTDSATNAHTA